MNQKCHGGKVLSIGSLGNRPTNSPRNCPKSGKSVGKPPLAVTAPKKPKWENVVDQKIKEAYSNSEYIDFTNASLQKLFADGKLKSVSYQETKNGPFAEMYLSDQSWVKFFPKTGAWKRFFPNGSMLVRYPDGSGKFEEKSNKNKMMLYKRDENGNFTEELLYPKKTAVPVDGDRLRYWEKKGNKCVSGMEYPDGSTEYTFEDGSRLVNNQINSYGYCNLEFKAGSNKPVSTGWRNWDVWINEKEMQTGGKETNLTFGKEWNKWRKHVDKTYRANTIADLKARYKVGANLTVPGSGFVRLKSVDFTGVSAELRSVHLKPVGKSGVHLSVTFSPHSARWCRQ